MSMAGLLFQSTVDDAVHTTVDDAVPVLSTVDHPGVPVLSTVALDPGTVCLRT
jgi:hypothetical protein